MCNASCLSSLAAKGKRVCKGIFTWKIISYELDSNGTISDNYFPSDFIHLPLPIMNFNMFFSLPVKVLTLRFPLFSIITSLERCWPRGKVEWVFSCKTGSMLFSKQTVTHSKKPFAFSQKTLLFYFKSSVYPIIIIHFIKPYLYPQTYVPIFGAHFACLCCTKKGRCPIIITPVYRNSSLSGVVRKDSCFHKKDFLFTKHCTTTSFPPPP